MENINWSNFSPMEVTFRAYDPGEKRDEILDAVSSVLTMFADCEAIQIEITAPVKSKKSSNKKEVQGFRAEKEEHVPNVIGFAD